MPQLTRKGDVSIHYEVHGDGFPVLAIAPGGMQSALDRWSSAPFDPVASLSDRYRVITMDQRNAGKSWAPVRGDHGWTTYTADQLAVLDHLGVERFAAIGMCIGGPYVLRLCLEAPDRVAAGILLQPIGLEDNRDSFDEMFDRWAGEIEDAHPEAEGETWAALRRNMFGGDFVFGATRAEVAGCETPLLVCMGDDRFHPRAISEEVAEVAPNATLIERWKTEPDLSEAAEAIRGFLAKNAS